MTENASEIPLQLSVRHILVIDENGPIVFDLESKAGNLVEVSLLLFNFEILELISPEGLN